MSEELQKTPLNAFHREHGARMVPFAGWEMPVQYTSILDEHRSVRNAAGMFDVSHMGEVKVQGPDAKRFLNYLVTNDTNRLEPNKALYAIMCYEDGGVVDDLIIYELAEDDFLLCINASNSEKDVEWITGQAIGFNCHVKDVSDQYAQIAVQGPNAMEIVAKSANRDFSDLGKFRFVREKVWDSEMIISRTGYTGEDGVELYLPTSDAPRVAEKIFADGQELGLTLTGLGARDSLRLEAGLPLYGHEISTTLDPITGSLAWVVKLMKNEDFIGKTALQKIKDEGPAAKVVHFIIENRRIARQGTTVVTAEGTAVGEVLSGTLSPILDQAIGSAKIKVKTLEAESPLFVELRGKQIPIKLTRPPLHKS